MSRRVSPLVIVCVLATLSGCGSGDKDEAKTTTTTTTPAAAASDTPKLSAAQSRRAAGVLLDQWSAQIIAAAKALNEREQASVKGLREPYYKADARLRAILAKIDTYPAQARRSAGRWAPQSLTDAIVTDGDAWKDWADGIIDIRAAAERGQLPEILAGASVLAHLAAYKAAKRTAPANFRSAARQLPSGA